MKIRAEAALQQAQKLVPREVSLPENVAQRALWHIAGMQSNHRAPQWVVLVLQKVVTTLDTINHEAGTE
jgi:hypothetical protein